MTNIGYMPVTEVWIDSLTRDAKTKEWSFGMGFSVVTVNFAQNGVDFFKIDFSNTHSYKDGADIGGLICETIPAVFMLNDKEYTSLTKVRTMFKSPHTSSDYILVLETDKEIREYFGILTLEEKREKDKIPP